jgi:hypothetical protein
VRLDRLRELAEFMYHKVPEEHFNMATWGRGAFADLECGSAACALGWATVCFKGELVYSPGTTMGEVRLVADPSLEEWDVAKQFFELDTVLAEQLFVEPDDVVDETPKQWATRCMEFIAKHETDNP